MNNRRTSGKTMSCKEKKSRGGIPGGVDACRCHLCKRKRKGREDMFYGIGYSSTKKKKGIDMASLAV